LRFVLDVHQRPVEAIARSHDGRFVLAGICWVVERSFAWLSRYRRLNTIFARSKEHLIAFVAIAFISILSRRIRRLVTEEVGARRLQTASHVGLTLALRPLALRPLPCGPLSTCLRVATGQAARGIKAVAISLKRVGRLIH